MTVVVLAVCCFGAAAAFIWCTKDVAYEPVLTAAREDVKSPARECATLLSEEKENEATDYVARYAQEQGVAMLLMDDQGAFLCEAGADMYFDIEEGSIEQMLPSLCKTETRAVLEGGLNKASGVHPLTNGSLLQKALGYILPCRESQNWYAVVVQSLAEDGEAVGLMAYFPNVESVCLGQRALYRRALMMVSAAVLLLALVWLILYRRLMKPLGSINHQIEQLGHGNFEICTAEVGPHRIRTLCRTLNNTSARLEELDQSRSQFVSNASHELKTPLATMKALLENIIYSPKMDGETRTEFLIAIDREINRLSMIVRDLLTLVGMDSKTVRLTRTCFTLADLIRENIERLQPMIDEKKQKLTLEVQNDCPMYADEPKLSQVVYNLIENACKYTPAEGNITVTLRQSNFEAIFTVSDSGPGIPKEDQEHIFERFYRVDKARSRETGGTGLGLSIVRQMVLLHGGTVTVSSDGSHGTTFKVTLQVHQNP